VSAPYKIGDRVRLTAPMRDDYPPPGLPAGLEGTVNWVGQWVTFETRQVGVMWDNGRQLMLLPDVDRFEVIT
jgi:hypothetical protein